MFVSSEKVQLTCVGWRWLRRWRRWWVSAAHNWQRPVHRSCTCTCMRCLYTTHAHAHNPLQLYMSKSYSVTRSSADADKPAIRV